MALDFTTSYAAIIKQEKQDDGTLLVYGKATDDAIDSDNQICDAGWLNRAMPEWFKSGGNIREQHSNIAAGVAKELDSKDDGHYISALVVDASSVKKVEAGVLKGFSIGIRAPRIVRDNKAANGRIIDGQIVEVSLVDRPANPNAKLMLAKSNGTEVVQVEEMIEEALPAATENTTTPETVEAATTEEKIIDPIETVTEDNAEKRSYGESAEEETAEGSFDSAAHEVAETKEKMCKECGKMGKKCECDKSMMKEKEKSLNKCLECGCHKPADSHGSADVTTAEMVQEKSSTTILPRIGTEGQDMSEDGLEDDEDITKSALDDTVISAIIEKAVKSATESVTSEIALLKSATEAAQAEVNKLQGELATANQKAVNGGPKRSIIANPLKGVDEFTRRAIEYRIKSANTSDPVLARGYKELAAEQEANAKALQITD